MTEKPYRFFIAGIIQGSKLDSDVHDQTYREKIKRMLKNIFPGCEIICPVENHPNSVAYNDEQARRVFLDHVDMVKNMHCLIVYLPEASMGSAIEMWEAYSRKIVKITISPMTTNWVVRILSDRIFPNIETFEQFAISGQMKKLLEARLGADQAGEKA
jgi:hypothetical protein